MSTSESIELMRRRARLEWQSRSGAPKRPAVMLCAFIVPLLLAGCAGIPSNAVKLSELQIQHLEQYRDSVQSIIDSHRTDAEALIAERERGYDRLIQRGEDFRKELYRLASHLLSRESIPEQPRRFQESLADNDHEVVRILEQHINRRIERYEAASSRIEIDVTAFLELKKQNRSEEIRKILDRLPSELSSLRTDVENLLMYEPFDEARALVVSRIEDINEKTRARSPDVGRLADDLRSLIAKVDDIETAVDAIRARRADYRRKAEDALSQFDVQLKKLESAGHVVVQTQMDLHGALRRVEVIHVQARDVLASVSPLIGSLGEAGIIKDEEAKALNEIVNGIKELLKDEEK